MEPKKLIWACAYTGPTKTVLELEFSDGTFEAHELPNEAISMVYEVTDPIQADA